MSVARLTAVAAVLLAAEALSAQKTSIRWGNDVKQAISQAKGSARPLMFWVLSSSGRRDDDIEDDQKIAFRDPLVVELSKRFVPARLSRSRHAELLEKWGLSSRTNLTIVFVKPDGEKIDVLGPGGVANKQSLAQKMSLVFRQYRRGLFNTEILPKLQAADASVADLKKALKVIDEFTILDADQAVVKLLERPGLNASIGKACYDVLAKLSTKPAVEALLERAADEDKNALRVLPKCTPLAAEQMLDRLSLEEPELLVPVYTAVTKICRVKKPKPVGFWRGKSEQLKNDELERVKERVRTVAQRWREIREDYR